MIKPENVEDYSCSHQKRSCCSNESGVTLVELIIYLVIAGMLLATAVTAFLAQNSSYNRQDVLAEIQQNIRGSREAIAADIRFAGKSLELNSSSLVPFETAEPQRIAVNLWDDVTNGPIGVHYRLDGNVLQRAVTSGGVDTDNVGTDPTELIYDWQTLAENIEQIRFEYMFLNKDASDKKVIEWRSSSAEIASDNTIGIPNTVDGEVLARKVIQGVKVVIQGGARESAFSPSDEATYNPPLRSLADWDPDPDPGTGYKQMVSFVVQSRNNTE